MYALTALVSVGIFACSKNNEQIADNENGTASGGSVELTLDGIGSSSSRAVGLPATVKTTVSNLTVLFADLNGDILAIEELSPQSNSDKWSAIMGVGDGNTPSPVLFHDLPEGVQQVHIYGNIIGKEGIPIYTVGANVSIFTTTMFDIANVTDISSTILSGKDTQLTPSIEPETGHTLWSAEFTIAPILARFEIGNIQCNDLSTSISSFNINAIGIDNVFEHISFDGTTTTAPETVKVLEILGDNSETIAASLPTWAHDKIIVTTVTTRGIYNPNVEDKVLEIGGDGKYVYHFVPQRQHVRTTGDAVPDGNSLGAELVNSIGVSPKIRLELTYVIPNEGASDPKRRWVTAIFDGEINPRTFQAGKIYQINLNFKESNIGTLDADPVTCVEASVKVADWEIEPAITPDFE